MPPKRYTNREVARLRTICMRLIGALIIGFALHYNNIGGHKLIALFIGLIGVLIIYAEMKSDFS